MGVPVLQFISVRSILGFIFTNELVSQKGVKIFFKDNSINKYLYIRGVLGLLVFLTWFFGVVLLPLGDAISLILISPILVVFMGWLFLKEKIGRMEILSAFIGFLGVVLISKPQFIFQLFNYTAGEDLE